ncbi:restriction endonuclease subunit S [Clostridiisalibacter paucivorans]|uniref:restriction endonuclease subunit S n=1 Tax=Clostridiisalibacter paucivorans TaxID=408753 RepID=UPI000A784F9F|nr:restriction endonuclease subunit S [Clostridiisalibacter paucivorans]
MTKNKIMPEIRFKGFTDDWKQDEFENVFYHLQNNSFSRAQLSYENGEVLNVHYGDILVEYGECLDVNKALIPKIIDNNSLDKYLTSYLENGDVIIADAAEDESVGKCCEIIGFNNEKILSGLHTIPCRPSVKFASGYLGYYMNSDSYHDQLLPLMQGTKVNSISKSALTNTYICYPPNIEEQKKVATFFSNLDDLITLQYRKLDKLIIVKKSMLDKMFPIEGESVPEVRFSGFNDTWETRKLGECFSERVESMPDGELISVTINNGVKKFSELGRHDNSNDDKSKYKKVCVGDIAYNSMRMWQGASGYSPYEGIVSPAYTVLAPNAGVDSKCISYLFKRPDMIQKFQINSQGITSDNWNLKYPALSDIEILISKDYQEQKRIAEYFSYLDDLITLQQRKVEKLRNIKSSCMERMFV